MVGVISSEILQAYNAFLATLPSYAQNFLNLFLLVLLIVIYSVFIWKFYRFISTKNILDLNLSKYNKSAHPFFTKLLAGIFYFIEYIIILPFLIFFWFAVFTLFLIVLTESQTVANILLISATVIAAIRMTSYIPNYGQKLSQEIAKMIPFTLLAISIITPGFFSGTLIEKALSLLTQLPNFFNHIVNYLIFIIILEIALRFFDFIISLFGLEDIPEMQEEV